MRDAAGQATKRVPPRVRRSSFEIRTEDDMAKVSRIASHPAAPKRVLDVFARLGVHGLGRIAPLLLAALAVDEPLLLIGPHGTGKTLLLTRITEALGLLSLIHI